MKGSYRRFIQESYVPVKPQCDWGERVVKAKIVLPIIISILLFSLVSGTRFVEKGVEVTSAVNSGRGFPSGLGESSVDWWPMFHHDLTHTGYSTSKAPKTNATLWSYTTGFDVYSSPAVADGRVYVGSLDKKVYCLNASTGSLIWSYTTGAQVFSSPAVADGKVYIGSRDYKVYAFGLLVSVSPSSVVMDVGQSQLFTSSVSGGISPYSYQWYLGGIPVSGATGASWTFAPSSAGSYTVYMDVNDSVGEQATSNIANVTVNVHDVAIKSVAPSTTEAYSGQTVNITVVTKNEGSVNETFGVSAYYDLTLIGTQAVTDLPQDEEKTLTFSWNTTDVPGGYYTISANATIVPGETDTADNNFIDGTITVTSPVRIAEVIPCNQTGYPKDTFPKGTLAFFKVTINSTALIAQNTLITINLYDNASITIGVESIQGPLLPGTSTYIFGLSIPSTATIGTATVYACAYTDWPSLGGFPHCPEMSATLEITGP
jgi:hypothetical protein